MIHVKELSQIIQTRSWILLLLLEQVFNNSRTLSKLLSRLLGTSLSEDTRNKTFQEVCRQRNSVTPNNRPCSIPALHSTLSHRTASKITSNGACLNIELFTFPFYQSTLEPGLSPVPLSFEILALPFPSSFSPSLPSPPFLVSLSSGPPLEQYHSKES